MPDKRDMHQAKSHRNSKTKNRNDAPGGKNRGRTPMSGNASVAVSSDDTTPTTVPMGKKNKSRR